MTSTNTADEQDDETGLTYCFEAEVDIEDGEISLTQHPPKHIPEPEHADVDETETGTFRTGE